MTPSHPKEPIEELRKKVARSIELQEMTNVGRWLDRNGEYYDKHKYEIIYAHTLVTAMRAVEADLAVIDLQLKDLETDASGNSEAHRKSTREPKEEIIDD